MYAMTLLSIRPRGLKSSSLAPFRTVGAPTPEVRLELLRRGFTRVRLWKPVQGVKCPQQRQTRDTAAQCRAVRAEGSGLLPAPAS